MQRVRPGVLGLALVLVLAGCGDDDGDGDGDGLDEAPATGETTPAVGATDPTPAPSPSPTGEEPEATPETYEVQAGDTLWDIAERFGVDVDAIVEANDIDDPSRIFPGDELVIPPGG